MGVVTIACISVAHICQKQQEKKNLKQKEIEKVVQSEELLHLQ